MTLQRHSDVLMAAAETVDGDRVVAVPPPDLEQLYICHVRALTRFAAALVGEDGADAVATVFARMLGQARPGVLAADDPLAYLHRAVYNECTSMRRRTARALVQRQTHPDVVENAASGGPVAAAVTTLAPRQRAVVVLTYWYDLTPAVVGERLGISEGAVRRHLARARARLRDLLATGETSGTGPDGEGRHQP